MNNITIAGNLTAAPSIRTNNDKKVANFTVAVNGRNHTDFIRCVAFGASAEHLEKNADKGDKVIVAGHLHTDSYNNKEGQKVNTVEVYARNVELFKRAASTDTEAPMEELPDDDVELPFS